LVSYRRSQDAEGVGQRKAAEVASPKEMRFADRGGWESPEAALLIRRLVWVWCLDGLVRFGGSVGLNIFQGKLNKNRTRTFG